MKIGYARVSTDEQNLSLQRDALRKAGCKKFVSDKGVSGNSTQRDGLDRALKQLKRGDVLVVWKLDRLGRSLRHLIELIETLRENGVGFQSLSDGISTTTAGGQLVFHIMGVLAEFERSLIIERTKAGLAAAKRRGKYPGRPKLLTPQQIKHARKLLDQGEETIGSLGALFGVDRTTIWRALQKFRFSNLSGTAIKKRPTWVTLLSSCRPVVVLLSPFCRSFGVLLSPSHPIFATYMVINSYSLCIYFCHKITLLDVRREKAGIPPGLFHFFRFFPRYFLFPLFTNFYMVHVTSIWRETWVIFLQLFLRE